MPDFPNLSQVAVDSTFDDHNSDPSEPELNLELYERLRGKAVNEVVIDLDLVPQQRSFVEQQDSANLGSGRGRSDCHGPLMLHLT